VRDDFFVGGKQAEPADPGQSASVIFSVIAKNFGTNRNRQNSLCAGGLCTLTPSLARVLVQEMEFLGR
jgi:hypothetical protein